MANIKINMDTRGPQDTEEYLKQVGEAIMHGSLTGYGWDYVPDDENDEEDL